MQTQHGAAAEGAILASERQFRARLVVDWNQDGRYSHSLSDLGHYVESVNVESSLSGSAPEEVLLIEGSASAELTAVLHGSIGDYALPAIFSPYNKRSPLYGNPMVGAEIRYEIGVEDESGTFWYPQFVGNIRTLTPSRADNTVTITALDRVEKLRRPVKFAPWAISEKHETVNRSTRAQLCNTTWVIDHCLRLSGVSQTPLRPPRREDFTGQEFAYDAPQLWINGTGSWLPTIGWAAQRDAVPMPSLDSGSLQMFSRIGQPHPQATQNMDGTGFKPFAFTSLGGGSQHFAYWGADRDSLDSSGVHHIGFTAVLNGSAQNNAYWRNTPDQTVADVFIGGGLGVRVKCWSGEIFAEIMPVVGFQQGASSQPGTANLDTSNKTVTYGVRLPDDGRNFVRVHIAIDMGGPIAQGSGGRPVTARLELDSGQTTGDHQIRAGNHWGGTTPNHAYKGYVRLYTPVSMNDFSWIGRRTGSGLAKGVNGGVPAEHAATLDRGLQNLTHIPLRNGDDAWEVISSVAGAEFGSVFWDEHGVFRFWNFETMLAKQNEVVRSFSLDDLSQLNITNTFDSVRNIWSTDMTKKIGIEGSVYEARSIVEFHHPPNFFNNNTTKYRVWSEDIISAHPTDLRKCTEYDRFSTVKLWDDSVTHGYVPTFWKGQYHTGDNTTVERWVEDPALHSNVAVNTFYDSTGSLVIQVWNNTAFPMRLATSTEKWTKRQVTNSSGVVTGETWELDLTEPVEQKPALRVGGTVINDVGSVTTTITNNPSRQSVKMYGGRNFKVTGEWVQYRYDAERTANVLMPRMLHPVPATDSITVAGDPRLQKGDLISVEDGSGFGSNIRFQIIGIDRRLSLDDGLVDVLTVEMIQPVPLNLDPEAGRPQITRRNLCPNPAFQAGNPTGGDARWHAAPSSAVQGVTEMPRENALWTGQVGGVALPRIRVTEGETYRMSVYAKGSSGASGGGCSVDWYGPDGWMGGQPGTPWTVSGGAVARIDSGAVTVPPGVTHAVLAVQHQGQPVHLTAALYEQTDQLRDYFDGDTSLASWDGTRGLSASRVLADADVPNDSSDSAATRLGWGAVDPSSDEFDGPAVTLDPVKWSVYGQGGARNHDGTEGPTVTHCWVGHGGNGRRCAHTVTQQDGFMRITGYENGDTGGITHKFDQRYGRWEIRARMFQDPGATGFKYHPVLIIWPTSDRWPWDGEYDFLEVNIGDQTAQAWLHYPHDGMQDMIIQQERAVYPPGLDLTEWHNYGFEWTADGVVGYIDGIEWFRFAGGAREASGRNPARRNMQDMPSGHLTIQMDNFNRATQGRSGMQKAYMDVAWARAYPLRALQPPPIGGGADGSLNPPR